MPWQTLVQLILSIGAPAALGILQKIESGAGNPTAAEFQELLNLTTRTARDRMLLALKAQGIDSASPQGLALLAAVG